MLSHCVSFYFWQFFDGPNMSSTAFIEPLLVIEFMTQLLNQDMTSRLLSDANRVKVRFHFVSPSCGFYFNSFFYCEIFYPFSFKRHLWLYYILFTSILSVYYVKFSVGFLSSTCRFKLDLWLFDCKITACKLAACKITVSHSIFVDLVILLVCLAIVF